MSVKIDLSELEAFTNSINEVQEALPAFDADFMRKKFEQFIHINAADPDFPYDTGHMLNSFNMSEILQDGGLTMAEWQNLAEYAGFVNYGTVHITPRYFWEKALNALQSEEGKRYAELFATFFDSK